MASNTPLGNGSSDRPQISIFRPSEAETGPPGIRLDQLLCEMESEIRCLARPNIVVQVGCLRQEPGLAVALSLDEAQDLIRHLVIDACDAMPRGGMLSIIVGTLAVDPPHLQVHPDLPPGNYVTLLVRDTGNGVAGNGIETLDSPHAGSLLKKGRALGLSAAHEAIQRCDGSMAVSKRQHETAISVYFPRIEIGTPE